MSTSRASELPMLIVSGADSPRSRIGKGLESIGGMTAETLQRLSTAVGGVVKSPVVLMGKVGGLASPRAATLAAPPESSLEERVHHLEIQMKSLEEKFNSMTIVTELDLPSYLHKEKPHMAKSLFQETDTDNMLVKRVQMLEDCVTQRMDRFEKALSNIQSRLDHVEFKKRDNMSSYEHQVESLSSEPQYYDAEQQSDSFEALEAIEQNIFGAHDVFGEATRGSPTLEKSRMKETSSIAPTIAKHTNVQENDDFLEPQVVSTPVYSKEAFLTHPMKSTTPTIEPTQPIHRDDASNFPASSEQQLASTLEELHGSFVMESLTTTASAKFLEIARAVTTDKSTLEHASLEPREAFLEEPLDIVPLAKPEEHVQEDANKNDSTFTIGELQSPPTFEATQKVFMEEPLATTPNAKYAQELATQGIVIIALASSEPPMTSKSMEEPSINSKELSQDDIGGNSVTMTSIKESPKAFAFQDLHEDFTKEPVVDVPRIGTTYEPSLQEDSSTTSDTSIVSSKSMERPLVVIPSVNFEELTQEDVVDKAHTMMVATKLSSALEKPKDGFEKESMAPTPSGKVVQEHGGIGVSSFEFEGASTNVSSANFEECEDDVDVDERGTIITSVDSPLVSTFDDLQKDFEKESSAIAPSVEHAQELAIQEDSSMALASLESSGKSKFAKDPLTSIASGNFEELTYEDANKGVTMIATTESSLPTSHECLQKDFEKEPLVGGPSARPIHEPSPKEDASAISDKAFASYEPEGASKFVEEPSPNILSANVEEPSCEDEVDKNITMIGSADLTLAPSYQGPREVFEKKSLVVAPRVGPIIKPSLEEDLGATSGLKLASFDPPRTSKFVEDPVSGISNANFEEPIQEDGDIKNNMMIGDVKSSLAFSSKEPLEEKESITTVLNIQPTQELATQEESDMVSASFEPKVESKFEEEPLTTLPSVGFDEHVHKDVDKSVNSAREDPQEDSIRESLVAPPNVEPTHELSSKEDLDATNNMALVSSTPHLASEFVEKPSPTTSSANFEEPTQDKDAIKNDIMSASADLPLASSFEEPQEAFEKEYMPSSLSHEPTQGLTTEEDSHIARTSFESQEASKFVEEPSIAVASANFEEPIYEDVVDKKVAIIATGMAPFASSFEGPQDDTKNESIKVASSIEPTQELATQEGSDMTHSKLQVASKFVEEPFTIDVSDAKFKESTHKNTIDKNGPVTTTIESPVVTSFEVHKEDYKNESPIARASAKVLELEEQDDCRKNPITFAPLEAPSTSLLGIPQETSLKEPLETNVQSKEPIQEKSGNVPSNEDLVLTSTMEESNDASKEVEYKLAEDFKVHEHIKSIEKELPRSQSNLAHVGSNKNLATEDSDNRLESDQSSEEFFDAEQGSGNLESWKADESKSFEEFSGGPYDHGEAIGINTIAQKEVFVLASSVEPEEELEGLVQEPTQEPEQALVQELDQSPTQELDQSSTQELEQDYGNAKQAHVQEYKQPPTQKQEHGHRQLPANESGIDLLLTSIVEEPQIDTVVSLEKSISTPEEALEKEPLTTASSTKIGKEDDTQKNDSMSIPLEQQLEESNEAFANKQVKDVPSFESTKSIQKVGDGWSGAILAASEPQLTPTLEEPKEGFVKEPLADAKSTSKSLDLEESMMEEPSMVTSTKFARESVADKVSIGLVEELPLTSITEEPQKNNENSLVEDKHEHDKVDQKFLKDVKIVAKPIEEAIPRTQSDLTHFKLNPEAIEDATKLQSQGSFLTFGATPVDSSEGVVVKEPLPSGKLLELFEEENDSGKKGHVLVDSPMTSTVEELPKPLAVELLASAKSTPKGRARWRGFARSSSEPQFAYKLEEHQKALAKGSSVIAGPSASKLGEDHIQEDLGDTQCLPFRILGEGKHPQKESEFKLVEDVKSLAEKFEADSNPYVLEPKPSKIKDKKKKEKKEKKPNTTIDKRLSLELGEMERKSSLKVEGQDSKLSPQAEEKRKQHFKHLRNRLRHAFSINKEP